MVTALTLAPRGSKRAAPVDEAAVRAALAEVPDPEIPVVSIVDLGLVHHVVVGQEGIRVDLLPTFVGCPALDVIRGSVEDRLAAFGQPLDVRFTYEVPWTSDRISPTGRRKLRESGFAPPSTGGDALVMPEVAVPCPHCGSRRTLLENVFGPTQCRSIRYCTECRQPFEAFKPV
jgi:ring-1,2-phenylacetyl-CoA epoxidase subunit PaaD